MTLPKLKVWLRDPLPVRITIKDVTYEIRPDVVAGGPGSMHLEAVRMNNGKSLDLGNLPATWYRDEYDRHAHFECVPGSPAYRLARALLEQGLAVEIPDPTWTYRYEHAEWPAIALGCEFHKNGWHRKESEEEPGIKLSGYLIRY